MAYRTHGMKYLSTNPIKIRPEYYVWSAMKARCQNTKHKQYPNYGGRGIQICSTWSYRFENFFNDMGERPSAEYSLGRIDNDGPYNPGNCRWELKEQQDNNKRTNVFVEHNGERLTIAQWATKIGLNTDTLWRRLKAGWSIEKALTQPHRSKKRAIELGISIDKTTI